MSAKEQPPVRIAVIGLGQIGAAHAALVSQGTIEGLQLTAVADTEMARCAAFPEALAFRSSSELIRSQIAEAVIIATPHYNHTIAGIEALNASMHVMVEKPISVHVADCRRLMSHARSDRKFAVMFNQRTNPRFIFLRKLLLDQALGKLERIQWTFTHWFRTEAYYRASSWRASWSGEGGGVLMNQAQHNLDLISWLFGQPVKVHAFCNFGRYHTIEVEDDVTAYLEFKDGAKGTIITSTGEAPGTDRLEVVGTKGKLVIENGNISSVLNRIPSPVFSKSSKDFFLKPPSDEEAVHIPDNSDQHKLVIENFRDAILQDKELIAPAIEGMNAVELANAILLSSWTQESITLPLDAQRYQEYLEKKAKRSLG